MKLKLNVENGNILYDFSNLTPEQVNVIRKALVANWGINNFIDDDEERICTELIDGISTVFYAER